MQTDTKVLALAASLSLFLAGCDVATTGGIEWEPVPYACKGSRFTMSYAFDPRIEEPLLWSGTGGFALEFTDLATRERVTLRNEDGWICKPAGKDLEPAQSRGASARSPGIDHPGRCPDEEACESGEATEGRPGDREWITENVLPVLPLPGAADSAR